MTIRACLYDNKSVPLFQQGCALVTNQGGCAFAPLQRSLLLFLPLQSLPAAAVLPLHEEGLEVVALQPLLAQRDAGVGR